MHATMSPNGRFIIINRWYNGTVPDLDLAPRKPALIDLVNRSAKDIVLGASRADVDTIGDVAFNHGWINSGLLAVHAFNQVIVFDISQNGDLAELGRTPISNILRREPTAISGPWLTLAWSTSGAQLIAASNHLHSDGKRMDEFVVIDVSERGRKLAVSDTIDACVKPYEPGALTVPLDVMTANGLITPPP